MALAPVSARDCEVTGALHGARVGYDARELCRLYLYRESLLVALVLFLKDRVCYWVQCICNLYSNCMCGHERVSADLSLQAQYRPTGH